VRDIDRAIADLERAAELMQAHPDEIEPDGQPNARNVPTSTLYSNTWYHLALAYYLKGDFSRAADLWRNARNATPNDDNLVAASSWLYLSLRRAGRAAEATAALAPIDADLDVIENGSYHSLLLMYKGERTPEAVLAAAGDGASGTAVRYGVGAWHLVNGRREDALRIWRAMLDEPDWPSFGHLAAEAEIAGRPRRQPLGAGRLPVPE
jgi:tetratricopeptide (TPR) repeat protein